MTEAELLSEIKPGMMIGILGEPGSGKTALGLRVAELLKKEYGLRISIYGVPPGNRDHYPSDIHFLDSIEDPSQFPTDSVVLYEELNVSAPARRSMSQENVVLCQLKNLRRHRNVTLICICQRASEMDKNLANSIQLLLVKRPEPFQHLPGSDRSQFQYHLKKAAELYKNPQIKNSKAWVYVSSLEKLVQTKLPTFWNQHISLSLGPPGSVGMRIKSKAGFTEPKPAHQMSRNEKIIEALILRMEGKSYREIGRDLAVHHTTGMSYCNNYRNHPLSRLPDEQFEALTRQAESEYLGRSGKQAPPETELETMFPGEEPEPSMISKIPESEKPIIEKEPQPASARVVSYGRCQTGHELQDEKRRPFCTECGARVIWGHKPALTKELESQIAGLEKQVDTKSGNWKEKLKVPGALGLGVGAGVIPFFAIDLIDDAIDDSDLSDKWKAGLKWTERGVDLALGIAGTATNLPRILKGEAEWYRWTLLGAALEQIGIGTIKSLELAGIIGEESASPREEPAQDRDWCSEYLARQEEETPEEEAEQPEEEEQDPEQLVTTDILDELGDTLRKVEPEEVVEKDRDTLRIKIEREEPPIIVETEVRTPSELTFEEVCEFYDYFLRNEDALSDQQKMDYCGRIRNMLNALEA